MRKIEKIEGLVIRQAKKISLLPAFNNIVSESRNFDVQNIDTTTQEVDKYSLGTAVYSNLVFEEGNYDDLDGNTINYASGGLIFNSAVFIVNVQKNIVKTQVLDRAGTVKEHITQGDYSVSCNCELTGEDGQRPDDLLREIRRILEVPQALTVTSVYLQLFGIEQIVIESSDVAQRKGSRNIIDFNFTASSDIPLEIELLNNL